MSGNYDGSADPPPTGNGLETTPQQAALDRGRLVLWVVSGLILLGLSYFAWQYVGTLIVGLFVYYVTRPVFERIHTRIHNRTLAVAVSLVMVALPVLFLVGWTLVIAVQALTDFLSEEVQDQIEAVVGPYLDTSLAAGNGEEAIRMLLTDPVQFYQTDLGTFVTGALEGFLASLGALGSAGLRAFIVLVVTFYLLRDDYRIAGWARSTFAREGSVFESYLVHVDRDLKNIFFGNILNALVTGLIAVVSFLVLNVFAPEIVTIPQPGLVGLLVGAASLVPAIGIKLVTWPLGFYLLARSALLDPDALWFPVVFFLVSSVVVDYIPDQLLRPYVSGRSLHVGAVMLAYLFGPILFGWYGIFLGPFLLAVVFEFGRIVLPWLVHPEEAPPSGETNEPPIREEKPVDEPTPEDDDASPTGDEPDLHESADAPDPTGE